jgi:hypothetical protein
VQKFQNGQLKYLLKMENPMSRKTRIDRLLSINEPESEMVSAAEVADWLGLTANRVNALARDGVLPRDGTSPYPRAISHLY